MGVFLWARYLDAEPLPVLAALGVPCSELVAVADQNVPAKAGKACLSTREHDHFTPTREIKRHVRAIARNHP